MPRLLNATPKQREAYEISGGGTGIHWDEIDEDISVKHLLMGIRDRTNPILSPSGIIPDSIGTLNHVMVKGIEGKNLFTEDEDRALSQFSFPN